jgi:hypothetical protein
MPPYEAAFFIAIDDDGVGDLGTDAAVDDNQRSSVE